MNRDSDLLVRRRAQVTPQDSGSKEVAGLEVELQEARVLEEKLGYSWLREKLDAKIGETTKPLAKVLDKLEVMVFTPESVEAYKAKKVADANAKFTVLEAKVNAHGARVAGMKTEDPAVCAAVGGACGLVFALIASISLCAAAVISADSSPLWLILSCLVGTVAGFLVGRRRYRKIAPFISKEQLAEDERAFKEEAKQAPRIAWQLTSLESYRDEVPKRACLKAIEIKRLLPYASFEVDHTKPWAWVKVDKEEWKPKADPFLVVSLGTERYYVDVWDEQDYDPRFLN